MTVDDVIIRHQLFDSPTSLIVTGDGQKLCFLVGPAKEMHQVEAPEGKSFHEMSNDDLKRVRSVYLAGLFLVS